MSEPINEPIEPLRILKFTGENVKRLSFVELDPDANFIVIAGNNTQGKSSILDSIKMALGGAGNIGARPIHDGASSAKIELDFGKFKVTRTVSGGGTKLVVEGSDGARYDKPQALLDDFIGSISFDPLEFKDMNKKDQVKTLMGLVGLDFTQKDKDRNTAYQQRASINSEHRREDTIKTGMLRYPGLEVIDVSAITTDMKGASEHNAEIERKREGVKGLERDLETLDASTKMLDEEIVRFKSELDKKMSALDTAKENYKNKVTQVAEAAAKLDEAQPKDLATFEKRMKEAAENNEKVAATVSWEAQNKRVLSLKGESNELSKKIKEIDEGKAQAVAKAKFPIKGLAFDDEAGVIYEGREFTEASDAEKIRVSVSIGVALHPKMPICLVKNGAMLDTEHLRLLHQLAIEKKAQIWVERVGEDGPASVIIEDGTVKEEKQLKI